MRTVVPIITGDFDIPNEGHLSFYNLASITDNTIVNPVLNFFDGAYPGTVDKKLRDDLYETIILNKEAEIPVAPNFSHQKPRVLGNPRSSRGAGSPRRRA